MKLPLVDEVRAARARAEHSSGASHAIARLRSAESELVALGRVGMTDEEPSIAPATLTEIATAWDLDLGPIDPADHRRLSEQLTHAIELLEPAAATAEEDHERVHDLQHRQVDQLRTDPAYAEALQQILEWHEARTQAAADLSVERQQAQLGRVGLDTIERALGELEKHRESQARDAIASAWVESINTIVQVAGIEGLSLPKQPFSSTLVSLAALGQHLEAVVAAAEARADELADQHQVLTDRIMELAG